MRLLMSSGAFFNFALIHYSAGHSKNPQGVIHTKAFKSIVEKVDMDDKTKVSLLYMLVGGIVGAASAYLSVFGVPNTLILALYIAIVYAVTYQYHLVGVKFERLGETRWRSALGGVFPSLLPWLVIWTMVFYMISPVVILADTSQTEAAEDLGEYLEMNGVSIRITDDYARHIFSRQVVIFGSRVPLPLGTNYGVTIFPDSVQRLLRLEKDKGTVTVQKIDAGEFITVKKVLRVIVIVSDDQGDVTQMVQENKETIYTLLTQ